MSNIKVPLAFTVLPAFLIALVLLVTENFSAHPKMTQAPLIGIFISVFTVIMAVVAYGVVKDEEEMEEEEGWKYKVLEGLNLGYIAVGALMILLIVTLYFLKLG